MVLDLAQCLVKNDSFAPKNTFFQDTTKNLNFAIIWTQAPSVNVSSNYRHERTQRTQRK